MANIGVECFATSYGQENRAEHDKAAGPVVQKKRNAMPGVDRGEHFRRSNDLVNPENADRNKP